MAAAVAAAGGDVERTATVLAGIFGAAGVALGALGAHALAGRLDTRAAALWETAARYQLLHAAALLGLAWAASRWPGPWTAAAIWNVAAGTAVFSGTLYALALGAPRWLGAVTPLGGLAMIAGWLLLGAAVLVGH